MAAGRKARARETQLAFEALTIEGGLLSSEWLSKVAQLQAAAQVEADYRIPKGLALRDEIGRFWRIAQAHWSDFRTGRERHADSKPLAERFVLSLLRESFGFGSLADAEPVELAGRSYPIGHHALGGRVPVVIAPAASGLDALSLTFSDDGRRRSAFGLTQEFLNAEEGALWGLTSDGLTLRLCRDNASLTRPAWIEADVARIFAEERYSDFAALWLLVHETRFGAPGRLAADCALEIWRTAGREEGTRARDKLREGFEDALLALGRGFLTNADNQPLRAALQSGQLARETYFQQLLRLVYRLIFLLTAEERAVLHPPDSTEIGRALYEKGYGLRRLRDRAAKRSAHDHFGDLWGALKITFRGVANGESRLALPALGGLFAATQCADLDAAKLENHWLLAAVFRLSWLREDSGLSRVNWRDMGPEELGSIYESLLELVPQVPVDGRGFAFVLGDETKGNARKTTGSYYTPDSLVQVLLDSALEPVIKSTIAAHPDDPATALLALSIVDPACGSGHFLLAAGRRLAGQVARYKANGTPSAEEYRHAVREVVSRCLYGVDLNPMAVELCRVSLWMEAVEPGRPLSFLDSHVQRGNALLGSTSELLARDIPDAAFEPIGGDDKKTASFLRRRNKAASDGQRQLDTLWSKTGSEVVKAAAALDAAPEVDLAAVASKEAHWQEMQDSNAFRHQRFVSDAWCASFVWPKPPVENKKPAPLVDAAPSNEMWRDLRDGHGKPSALTEKTVDELAEQYHFFHWHLAFPQVFARGGFDAILGNPPWDKLQVEEQHFFAASYPEIAGADARRRKKLIASLETSDPETFAAFQTALRQTLGSAHYIKASGKYPLASGGNITTHSIFLELALGILSRNERARLALLLPSGLATQDSQKELFAYLVDGRLRILYDFENSEGLFPAVHNSFRFAVVASSAVKGSESARFSFFLKSTSELREEGRVLSISADYLKAVSPNTSSCPLARSQRELDLLLEICRAGVALHLADGTSPWGWQSSQMFNETHESDLLVAGGDSSSNISLDRLYEAKLMHQFDHRYATYDSGATPTGLNAAEHADPCRFVRTRWMVPLTVWQDRVAPRQPGREWVLAFRRIARATDERTFIAAVLPRCGAGSQTPVATVGATAPRTALLVANLNAFAFDFAARLRSGGTDLNHFVVNQLFALSPDSLNPDDQSALLALILKEVLELTYTAWDLQPFAQDIGYDGPPFRWDPDRRRLLRAELDAAFFHLYGISRDDVAYILDTFPIVRKNDEKACGEYRTKRVILEVYDAMAEGIRSGKPYQTRLDPPPADPRVAHPVGFRLPATAVSPVATGVPVAAKPAGRVRGR